jgi:hypothetical protein
VNRILRQETSEAISSISGVSGDLTSGGSWLGTYIPRPEATWLV